jgi:hypothetical protein
MSICDRIGIRIASAGMVSVPGFGAAALALVAFAVAAPPALGQVALEKANHFLCYAVATQSGGVAPDLVLKDQFGTGKSKRYAARWVCNPVDKNGEGIPNKELHMVCYTVNPQIPAKPVLTVNQFKEMKFKLGSPGLLCVPSIKKVL